MSTLPVLRYEAIIIKVAKGLSLRPSLVAAIISQESAAEPYAARFEPGWRYFRDPEIFARKCRISLETERSLQATSFGLMQLMGSVAREYLFYGHLGQLFDPETNIFHGCRHLRKFLDAHKTEERAIVSYNAGSPRILDGKFVNQIYLDKVLAFQAQLLELDK